MLDVCGRLELELDVTTSSWMLPWTLINCVGIEETLPFDRGIVSSSSELRSTTSHRACRTSVAAIEAVVTKATIYLYREGWLARRHGTHGKCRDAVASSRKLVACPTRTLIEMEEVIL